MWFSQLCLSLTHVMRKHILLKHNLFSRSQVRLIWNLLILNLLSCARGISSTSRYSLLKSSNWCSSLPLKKNPAIVGTNLVASILTQSSLCKDLYTWLYLHSSVINKLPVGLIPWQTLQWNIILYHLLASNVIFIYHRLKHRDINSYRNATLPC